MDLALAGQTAVIIGGANPIVVQSMTTTDTFDVEGTIKQIHALEEAGCELVRVNGTEMDIRFLRGKHAKKRSGATSKAEEATR